MPAPRTLLSGRYRCVETFPLPDGACWWIAIDGDSGQHVARLSWPRGTSPAGRRCGARSTRISPPSPTWWRSQTPPRSLASRSRWRGRRGRGAGPRLTLHGQLARGRVHPFKPWPGCCAWSTPCSTPPSRRFPRRDLPLHDRGSPPVGRSRRCSLPSWRLRSPPTRRPSGSPRGPSADDDVWALMPCSTPRHRQVPYEGGAQSLLKR
jgi:hypothetical protein